MNEIGERLIFINSEKQSIELGNQYPYILTKIEGTGAVTTNIQTQKSPFQDGVTYIDNTTEPRTLSIEAMIIANNDDDMLKYRRNLVRVFNPKLGLGTLVYEFAGKQKQITAISELAPYFPDSRPFEDTMQEVLITLYCPDPMWTDTFIISKEIAAWIGGFEFPLELPTKFAEQGNQVNIYNDGDVATPVKIEFFGPAENPTIINTTTNEMIRVRRNLNVNQKLIINTEFGNKSVLLDGENAFNYIDLNSTFWQLIPGDNIIKFEAGTGQKEAKVLIKYRNRYVGV